MEGFTLVEILLVVTILAVLMAITLPVSLDFYSSQQLDTYAQDIVQTLRRAQLRAMAVEFDSSFGVHLDPANKKYVLFQGTSFDPADPENEEFELPQILSLNSPFGDVVFAKLTGMPTATGDINLTIDNDSRAININNFGLISLQQ